MASGLITGFRLIIDEPSLHRAGCILASLAQAETDAYLNTAFGEEVSSSGTSVNAYRYEGLYRYYRDAADRLDVGQRVPKPSWGRWLSRDPVGSQGGGSLYTYVDNNPLGRIDPSGLQLVPPGPRLYHPRASRTDDDRSIRGKTWLDILQRTGKWLGGELPVRIEYKPDDPATKALAASYGADQMRRDYASKGCPSLYSGSVGSFAAFTHTMRQPWNAQQAFMGGFDYVCINNGNGTVTYYVVNVTDTESLLYHDLWGMLILRPSRLIEQWRRERSFKQGQSVLVFRYPPDEV